MIAVRGHIAVISDFDDNLFCRNAFFLADLIRCLAFGVRDDFMFLWFAAIDIGNAIVFDVTFLCLIASKLISTDTNSNDRKCRDSRDNVFFSSWELLFYKCWLSTLRFCSMFSSRLRLFCGSASSGLSTWILAPVLWAMVLAAFVEIAFSTKIVLTL